MRKLIILGLMAVILGACGSRYYEVTAIGVPYLEEDLYITNLAGHHTSISMNLLFVPTMYSIPGVESPLDSSWRKEIQAIHFDEDVEVRTKDRDIVFYHNGIEGTVSNMITESPVEIYTEMNDNTLEAYSSLLSSLYIYIPFVCSNYQIVVTNLFDSQNYSYEDQEIYRALQEESDSRGKIYLTVLSNTNQSLWSNNITLLSNRIFKIETYSVNQPNTIKTLKREKYNFGIQRMSANGILWTDFDYLYQGPEGGHGTYDEVNSWDYSGNYWVNPNFITNLSLSNDHTTIYYEMGNTTIHYPLYNPDSEVFGIMVFNYREGVGYDKIVIK